MHRPTRQHRNLVAKMETKTTRSRLVGKKAKRYAKAIENYKELCKDDDAKDAADAS